MLLSRHGPRKDIRLKFGPCAAPRRTVVLSQALPIATAGIEFGASLVGWSRGSISRRRHPLPSGGAFLFLPKTGEIQMLLRSAVLFFILSVLAGLFGFFAAAPPSASVAQTLFFLFLSGFLVLLLTGLATDRDPTT